MRTMMPYQKEFYEPIAQLLQKDPYVQNDILSMLEEHPQYGTVMIQEDQVIAVSVYAGIDPLSGISLFVSEKCRRQGIGTAMMQQTLLHMKQAQIKEAICELHDEESFHHFCTQHGFQTAFFSHYMTRQTEFFPVSENIRPYTDEDYEEFAKLSNQAFHEMRVCVGMSSVLDLPNQEEREQFSHRAQDLYVLEREKEIVAILKLDTNEIDAIAVRTDLHRCGYGKHMLHFALNQLKTRGFDTATLWCVEGNPAYHLYQQMGFVSKLRQEFMKCQL